MVEDEGSKPNETEGGPPPEAPDQEPAFLELRDHVPAEIRNASFPVSVRGYDRRTVDAYVTRVNRVIAELEVSRSPQAAVRHALDRVGEQTIAILQEARESAEKIAAAAQEEAEETMGRAKAEAANLVVNVSAEADNTRAEAEQFLASARAEAEEILARSRAEGENTVARSRAQAAERLQQAKDEIAALEEEARARMRDLEADTDAVWNERDGLLKDIHAIATRLQEVAGAAAARASRAKAGEDVEQPSSESEPEAEGEPAAVSAADEPTEISTVAATEQSEQPGSTKKGNRGTRS